MTAQLGQVPFPWPDSLPRAGEWLYGLSCKRYKLWDPEIKECVRCKCHSQRLELSPSSLEPPTPPSTTPSSLSQRTSWIYIAWSSLLECRIKPRASTGLPSQGLRTKLTCPIEVNVLLQLYKEQKQQKLREWDFEMSPSYENWLLGLFKFSQAKCLLTAEKTSSYLNGVFFRSILHWGPAVLVCANAAHLSCWRRLIAQFIKQAARLGLGHGQEAGPSSPHLVLHEHPGSLLCSTSPLLFPQARSIQYSAGWIDIHVRASLQDSSSRHSPREQQTDRQNKPSSDLSTKQTQTNKGTGLQWKS